MHALALSAPSACVDYSSLYGHIVASKGIRYPSNTDEEAIYILNGDGEYELPSEPLDLES